MADIVYVGVLNITPDSFSDGGEYNSVPAALKQAHTLIDDGAQLLDIGAESTNPSSRPLTADQEITRLAPILPTLATSIGSDKFSLDTYHPETVRWVLDQDIKPIVNDVSGLHNPQMQELILKQDLRVIISHLPKAADGIPTRAHTKDYIHSIETVRDELLQTAQLLESRGLPRKNIILDPGIGFGKTMQLNWQLLDFPKHVPEYSVMLGYSRKRFLHTDPIDGNELPAAVGLKVNAQNSAQDKKAYEAWLQKIHAKILHQITTHTAGNNQTIYLRLHDMPAYTQTPTMN